MQDKVNEHRQKLEDLRNFLENAGDNPQMLNDANFEKQLMDMEAELDGAVVEAERAISKFCLVDHRGRTKHKKIERFSG